MPESTLNLSELIFNAINELCSKLFSSIDNTIYSLLDNIIFIDSNIISETIFPKVLGTSNNGLLLICNALIFGIILYYSINYLLSHLTYSKIDSPKQFIFKSIIFISLMNSSLWICEQLINIVSIITLSISNISLELFEIEISFAKFIENMNKLVYLSNDGFDLFSFNGIVKSFTTFGLVNLLFNYSLRYIMIQIFILTSPFAFLCLINSSTEWFFSVWLKSFLSLLLVQVLISLILLLSFSIDFAQDSNISKLLYIGIIYALTKANIFMKEIFGGISTNITNNFSNIFYK